jgi:hypothetical protein
MRRIAILTLAAVACQAVANPAEDWLSPRAIEVNAAKVLVEISRDLIVELPVSMFEEAEQRLQSQAIVELQAYDVENLSRSHFSCPRDTTAYLVRAVYTNGNTGGYQLTQLDSALWVSHVSLGVSRGMHRSALIACLRFKPSSVVVTSGGAM